MRPLERTNLEVLWEGSRDLQRDARLMRARSETIIRRSATMRDRLARQTVSLAQPPAARCP